MSAPGYVSYLDISRAITTTLAAGTDLIRRAQAMDELTEDYPDLPLLQVYLEESETEDVSFQSKKLNTEALYHADIPCRPRSHMTEDMLAALEMGDAVQTILENQRVRPDLFGLRDIAAFRWRWMRATFSRGGGADGPVLYVGVRFYIHVRVI